MLSLTQYVSHPVAAPKGVIPAVLDDPGFVEPATNQPFNNLSESKSERSEEENKDEPSTLTNSVLAEIVLQAKRMKYDKACAQTTSQTSRSAWRSLMETSTHTF